jgi:hypothetical protein
VRPAIRKVHVERGFAVRADAQAKRHKVAAISADRRLRRSLAGDGRD